MTTLVPPTPAELASILFPLAGRTLPNILSWFPPWDTSDDTTNFENELLTIAWQEGELYYPLNAAVEGFEAPDSEKRRVRSIARMRYMLEHTPEDMEIVEAGGKWDEKLMRYVMKEVEEAPVQSPVRSPAKRESTGEVDGEGSATSPARKIARLTPPGPVGGDGEENTPNEVTDVEDPPTSLAELEEENKPEDPPAAQPDLEEDEPQDVEPQVQANSGIEDQPTAASQAAPAPLLPERRVQCSRRTQKNQRCKVKQRMRLARGMEWDCGRH